ncbi:relA-associated inhibitor-like [Sinocyclocheilus anshuiensis]|uniref:relA-associated inhibitor-like n=1 Tax=Sinocyclocheilus anshuiensis TaxID=1608454 RepID=UPI0007B92F5A|nr:PREDICTED: relA-associated inhibitor-like [Sinocyclocheilus anshuiensis]
MNSQGSFGSSFMFQSINDELNASLATADELSREFSSLLSEATPAVQTTTSESFGPKPQSSSNGNGSLYSANKNGKESTSFSFSQSSTSSLSSEPAISRKESNLDLPSAVTIRSSSPSSQLDSMKFLPSSPSPLTQQHSPFTNRKDSSDSRYSFDQKTPPNMSPNTMRRMAQMPLRPQDRSTRGSLSYGELSSPTFDNKTSRSLLQPSASPLSSIPRSPRLDRAPSPQPLSQPAASTLPRNFQPFRLLDERMQMQKNPSKWNETDLDAYERKPHHTYDKNEWIRPSVPNSNWKESNLDAHPSAKKVCRLCVVHKRAYERMQMQKNPSKWNETDLDAYERKPHHTYDKNEWIRPSVPNSNWKESNLDAHPSAKKDTVPRSLPSSHSSLPRNTRISVPPELASSTSSTYGPQSIISRIPIPPASSGVHQHRPIPLSVIMRLQNPYYAAAASRYAPVPMGESQQGIFHQHLPLPREYLRQNQTPQPQQPLRQPPYYREVLHPGDVDAELERPVKTEGPVYSNDQRMKPEEEVNVEDTEMPPRPLSPTRLQPVVAPQAELDTYLDEVMRIRAEFPRALKKRGSVEIPQTLYNLPVSQPNHYKQMINKLFHRKTIRIKEEPAAESSSSSDGEESSRSAVAMDPVPVTEIQVSSEQKGIHSILRKGSKANKSSSRRAHLNPLVLMLDGSLVGELETVQRAAQEVSDPSQANDEGITALHNAICGGHFPVVEFLVRIGANVSTPDSHGWTPLHCAASCNDRQMCEFLVRNGAAVMAVTDSDGATAAQKCDPFAPGFEECESFLRGVEEAMGVENSGVVYALWGYPAQGPDELSFKEGDMVTILQKPEGVDWWWASLCGREGFVPNNYFGLFPKVRPKSLC